jgi:hypothetical protein
MVRYSFDFTLLAGIWESGNQMLPLPSPSLNIPMSIRMKLIVDPGDVYQLAIPNFNMQLAKISNYATYAVSYLILHLLTHFIS